MCSKHYRRPAYFKHLKISRHIAAPYEIRFQLFFLNKGKSRRKDPLRRCVIRVKIICEKRFISNTFKIFKTFIQFRSNKNFHCFLYLFTLSSETYEKYLQSDKHLVEAGQKIRCDKFQIVFERKHQHECQKVKYDSCKTSYHMFYTRYKTSSNVCYKNIINA